MGFIKDNTNTFIVYLTDIGKQKFLEGGLKDSIFYFSLSDDSNYNFYQPNIEEIPVFDSVKSGNGEYKVGDYVVFNTKYYVLKQETTSSITPNLNLISWDLVKIFNPKTLQDQSIAVLTHGPNPSYKTSLPDSGAYVSDVFTQTALRGTEYINCIKTDFNTVSEGFSSAYDIDINGSKIIKKAILGTKRNTQKSYLIFSSEANPINTYSLLTYTEIVGAIPNFS